MRTPFKIAILASVLSLGTTACVPPPGGPPPNYAVGGTLLGAAAGAAIGHDIHPTGGALVGGLTGALIGGAIGNDMDWRAQGYYNQQPYNNSYDNNYGYTPSPRDYDSPPYDGY